LIDVKNNQQVSLSDFNDKAGIVIVFTSNYYLKEAIEATLKNKTPLVGYKRPTGCIIKN